MRRLFCLAALLAGSPALAAKTAAPATFSEVSFAGHPLSMMATLAVMALLPFAILMLTSFSKIAVVLSLTRSAMGTQQAPPTIVLTGLAAVLSGHIMAPVVERMYDELGATGTVEHNLPQDDRVVRELHASEVLGRPPVANAPSPALPVIASADPAPRVMPIAETPAFVSLAERLAAETPMTPGTVSGAARLRRGVPQPPETSANCSAAEAESGRRRRCAKSRCADGCEASPRNVGGRRGCAHTR